MNFATWEPVYEAILADFGYPRADDEAARDLLAALLESHPVAAPEPDALADATVAIAGGARTLAVDVDAVDAADVTVATATAARRLRTADRPIDWIVTDLDGDPALVRDLSRQGVGVVVHAHGDNRDELRRWVPELAGATLVPTTQAEPAGRVRNFGGFTDGDRAAFFADALGAASLSFPGWDFDDPTVDPEKRRKLRWAERLLFWLERRRGERFDVLSGRRAEIDASALPE